MAKCSYSVIRVTLRLSGKDGRNLVSEGVHLKVLEHFCRGPRLWLQFGWRVHGAALSSGQHEQKTRRDITYHAITQRLEYYKSSSFVEYALGWIGAERRLANVVGSWMQAAQRVRRGVLVAALWQEIQAISPFRSMASILKLVKYVSAARRWLHLHVQAELGVTRIFSAFHQEHHKKHWMIGVRWSAETRKQKLENGDTSLCKRET